MTELSLCGDLLVKHKLSVAFAESATAGRLASEFSLLPDAGKFLKGGIVCYDACLKQDILKVPEDLIEKYTPESAEVTLALARGLHHIINADLYIAVTGLTAPGGSEGPDKPVGTIFVAVVDGNQQVLCNSKTVLDGSAAEIVLQTVGYTARLLNLYLLSIP